MDIIEHQQEEFKETRRGIVHFILVHSYLIFLFAVILGVLCDTFLNEKIFSDNFYDATGFLILSLGTIIIYWAQSSSANYKERTKKNEHLSHFEFGPYRYLRSPTHFGLFIMTLGLALVINSLFSVIFTFVAYLVTKLFFLKKEEKVLENKYGQIYRDYKKKVRNWI